jgi:hypothetical protein
VLRSDQEPPESFTSHPLFYDEGTGPHSVVPDRSPDDTGHQENREFCYERLSQRWFVVNALVGNFTHMPSNLTTRSSQVGSSRSPQLRATRVRAE